MLMHLLQMALNGMLNLLMLIKYGHKDLKEEESYLQTLTLELDGKFLLLEDNIKEMSMDKSIMTIIGLIHLLLDHQDFQ